MTTETLDTITIRGFRSIAAVEALELRRLNVLIGANGSGKSNFLALFSLLREIRDGRLQGYVAKHGGADRILYFGAKQTPELHVELWFRDPPNGYQISLEVTDDNRLYPTAEKAKFWDQPRNPRPFDVPLQALAGGLEAGISGASEPKSVPGWVRARLGLWTTYHFHDTGTSAPLRRTAAVNDNRSLRPDGANLPAFLYLLRSSYPDSYRTIRQITRRVTPFFDDFVLEPLALQPDSIRLEWRHKGSDKFFDVASLSDGMLRFIALATLLLQPAELRPPTILIDEPELGLHPAAITMLGSLIRMASSESQVILSTQSPLLLDQFEAQDVIVAERVGMATQLRRLDSERLSSWLEDYSLGELWEKNELGGRP